MTPLYFGERSRRLFGLYTPAHATGGRARGAVLCAPWGAEYLRAHRSMAQLGKWLGEAGVHVLRFDYHGTGDSPGEESAQSLDDWVQDTLAAHELLAGDGELPVHWFGMGLGAVTALRAALLARHPPRHLVLWEPVFKGSDYLDALIAGHKTELSMMFAQPWEQIAGSGKVAEPTLPGDVLGFELGERLVAELRALPDLIVLPALRRVLRITCAVRGDQPHPFNGHAALPTFKLHTVEHPTDWMSSQAMGTAIAPPDIPRVLLSTID